MRSATLGLTVEDLRLGDLVYDSLVYLSGQPTLERFDASLTTTLQRCRRLFVGMQRLLRQRKVCALVLSDRAYIDYGIPTRVALARQIPVYVRSGLNPSSIRKYNRLEQQSEFPDVESQAIVQHYRVKLGPQLAALADAFYPPAPSKVADFAYFRFGYGEGKREEVGEALARRLGLDPRKKTCCLMSHVFYDAPHVYPDTLFDDHFQWLVETLKFAAKTPALNWLVRQHPFEVMAGENAAFHRAVDRFVESGTVSVVPPEVTTSSLFSCVDAITTVHGSAGIEFPSAGIPCILAGRPFYGDYPFVVRARTRNEYFHALENIPGLGKVSGDALLLAKEVAFVEFKCLPVLCNRLPENGDLAGRKVTGEELAMWWRSAATLAAMTKAEDDPLFANLRELQPRPGVVLRI